MDENLNPLQKSDLENQVFQFSLLLKDFCSYVNDIEPKLLPYTRQSLPYFRNLTAEQAKAVYENFKSYCQSCDTTIRDFGTLSNNLLHFGVALRHLKLSVDSSVTKEISTDDVIEIYDSNSIQSFRSKNFFNLVSYTLEEIFCRPWFELYKRDHFTERANMEALNKVISGESGNLYFPNIPDHVVLENRKSSRYRTKIKHRFIAPTFNREDQIEGFVNVFKVIEHSS